ncbi:MAG: hypothetical protein SGJ16_01805 [Nitrospirota bacterium]|nr:hypothetical protein [Nitrospirota bacterium]
MATRFIFSVCTIGALGLTLLWTGCTVRRVVFNDVVTTEQVNFIRVGQTTILELADHIGAPDEVIESEFGVVALYNWSDTKSAALDFGALARLVLPYAPTMTLNKTGITPEQFQVVFDPQWTVRAYGFSRRTTDEPVVWFWPF